MRNAESALFAGLERAATTISGSKAGSIPAPQNDEELWEAVRDVFNIAIPRVQVCKHHVAPFQAFADAYFARNTVTVWKASRGFGGKSLLLALLGLCESVFLGAKVNILGGSGEQSERVLNYINGQEMPESFWNAPDAPRHLIQGGSESDIAENARGITKKMIQLTNGGYLKALMASSRSVRGPHPQRLRLDEADEMDLGIFDSALGQPMKRFGIEEQVVASSTHHYANGTMTEILKRAVDKDWGIYEWCYRENLVSNGGWLDDNAVIRKKHTVTVAMWDAEYENQEPNPTGRAIDPDKIPILFTKKYGEFKGDEHEYIQIEGPDKGGLPEPFCHRCKHPYLPDDIRSESCVYCDARRRLTRAGTYAHGADWAKKKDWTVITTLRTDVTPVRCVAWERTGRLSWPVMIGKFENRIRLYGGSACHDMTGIGGVIDDYLQVGSEGVIMQGLPRAELLSHYITAIEHGRIEYPWISFAHSSHKLASVEDVFRAGDANHLPDDMAAGALAWKAAGLGATGDIYIPYIGKDGKIAVKGTSEHQIG